MAGDRFLVIAVAASAGGIPALGALLSSLPPDLTAAVLIVQHLAPAHSSILAGILRRSAHMAIAEAAEGDRVEAGVILVAPPGHHMLVTPKGTISLTDTKPIHFVRPSADVLFESVASAFGPRAVGVVLSGAGEDGAHGAEAIRQHGGKVIAQCGSAPVFFAGMSDAAIRLGAVDQVLPVAEIGAVLATLAGEQKAV